MNVYGLIGHKLEHSFSKKFFSEKFKELNLEATYENFELSNINQIKKIFSTPEICGLNVTIPYKESIIPYLTEVDEEASVIEAVNTIKPIIKDGKKIFKGYNTDVHGFYSSIKPLLNKNHSRALIFGTGGSAKAVAFALLKLDMNIQYASSSLNSTNDIINYADLKYIDYESIDVIINCTPIGLFPRIQNSIPLNFEKINSRHLVYDLIYNPTETKLLHECSKQGATTKNGLEMLHLQAEKSWNIWNN